jgi:hypothetical protein
MLRLGNSHSGEPLAAAIVYQLSAIGHFSVTLGRTVHASVTFDVTLGNAKTLGKHSVVTLSRPIYPPCARARAARITQHVSRITHHASRSSRRTNPNHPEPFRTLEIFFPVKIPPSPNLIRYQLQLIAPTYAKLRQKIFRAKCNSSGAPDFTRKQYAPSSIEIQNSKFKNPSPQLPIAHAPRAPRSR